MSWIETIQCFVCPAVLYRHFCTALVWQYSSSLLLHMNPIYLTSHSVQCNPTLMDGIAQPMNHSRWQRWLRADHRRPTGVPNGFVSQFQYDPDLCVHHIGLPFANLEEVCVQSTQVFHFSAALRKTQKTWRKIFDYD